MTLANKWIRRYKRRRLRKKLRNHDFTILASNCNGGMICHELGEAFRSPFVNLWTYTPEFIRFLEDPKRYLDLQLEFVQEPGVKHPVAMLGDMRLFFQHYPTKEAVLEQWQRRKDRINWDNLFVLVTDQYCTEEDLRRFDALPYKNKVVFTHIPMPQIASAVYIPGFENRDSVGVCSDFVDGWRGKRYYDSFDFVDWLNKNQNNAHSQCDNT